MRIAISNIAWLPEHDGEVADILRELGVEGIEIAPTVIWPEPATLAEEPVRTVRDWWEARGIQIVALQALLYGHPELTVFGSHATREATIAYLTAIIRLGGWLGAGTLVFGSPKNRRIDDCPAATVEAVALDFFRSVGEIACAAGARLCIEPNPIEYDCDYLTSAESALEAIQSIDHPGVKLHLDAAAMTLSGDASRAAEIIDQAAPFLQHFHISEPYLAPIGKGDVNHAALAASLRSIDYDGWCSIEMRGDHGGEQITELRRALEFAIDVYGR